MRNTALLAAAATLLVTGCGVALAADESSRDFPVGSFQRIETGGAADVVVKTGVVPSVRATGDSSRIEKLDVTVENGTLRIREKSSWWGGSSGKLRIAVGTGTLTGIGLSGAGDVSVDRVVTPKFEARVSGAADLKLANIAVDSADLSVSGAGTITAAGTAKRARAAVSGAGDVKIASLRTETLEATVSGAGDIEAFATQTASARVSGAGDIKVRGGARCQISKSGAGSVDCA